MSPEVENFDDEPAEIAEDTPRHAEEIDEDPDEGDNEPDSLADEELEAVDPVEDLDSLVEEGLDVVDPADGDPDAIDPSIGTELPDFLLDNIDEDDGTNDDAEPTNAELVEIEATHEPDNNKDPRNPFDRYLREIVELRAHFLDQAEPSLSPADLVRASLPLVVFIAKRYSEVNPLFGFEDIVQEGNLGLIEASKRFDPSKGFKFSTYAIWWIKYAITRSMNNNWKNIRKPVHLTEKVYRIRKIRVSLIAKICRPPTLEELAVEIRMKTAP
ncbi:MAG: sigma-70 family RNA polymerase sigma factor [Candidatus Gracilibacteria bacterium]